MYCFMIFLKNLYVYDIYIIESSIWMEKIFFDYPSHSHILYLQIQLNCYST